MNFLKKILYVIVDILKNIHVVLFIICSIIFFVFLNIYFWKYLIVIYILLILFFSYDLLHCFYLVYFDKRTSSILNYDYHVEILSSQIRNIENQFIENLIQYDSFSMKNKYMLISPKIYITLNKNLSNKIKSINIINIDLNVKDKMVSVSDITKKIHKDINNGKTSIDIELINAKNRLKATKGAYGENSLQAKRQQEIYNGILNLKIELKNRRVKVSINRIVELRQDGKFQLLDKYLKIVKVSGNTEKKYFDEAEKLGITQLFSFEENITSDKSIRDNLKSIFRNEIFQR